MKKKSIIAIWIALAVLILTPILFFFFINMPRIIPRPLHIDESFTELEITKSQNDIRTVLTFNKRACDLSVAVFEEENGILIPSPKSQNSISLSEDEFDLFIETVNKYGIPACEVETFDQLNGSRNTLLLSPQLLISTSTEPDTKLSRLYDELESMFLTKNTNSPRCNLAKEKK